MAEGRGGYKSNLLPPSGYSPLTGGELNIRVPLLELYQNVFGDVEVGIDLLHIVVILEILE